MRSTVRRAEPAALSTVTSVTGKENWLGRISSLSSMLTSRVLAVSYSSPPLQASIRKDTSSTFSERSSSVGVMRISLTHSPSAKVM